MCVCMYTVRVSGMYQPMLVYDGVSLLQKKNVFFFLFHLTLSQQVLLVLEVVLGLAFSLL